MTAKVISDRIVVKRYEFVWDKGECLVIGMPVGADYEKYRAMPDCLEFRGRLYKKSLFNTDKCEYYYRTNKVCERVIG